MKAKRREYMREYWAAIIGTVLPPHEPIGQGHCRDCLRAYKREKIQQAIDREIASDLLSLGTFYETDVQVAIRAQRD